MTSGRTDPPSDRDAMMQLKTIHRESRLIQMNSNQITTFWREIEHWNSKIEIYKFINYYMVELRNCENTNVTSVWLKPLYNEIVISFNFFSLVNILFFLLARSLPHRIFGNTWIDTRTHVWCETYRLNHYFSLYILISTS